MKRKSITLRGAAANAFIAQSHNSDDLPAALDRSTGPAKKAIAAEIVRRGLQVAGVCSRCGCTDEDCSQCVAKTGQPCSWVNLEGTLCSACEPATNLVSAIVDYQKDCKTLDEVIGELRKIYGHPDWRFARFDAHGVDKVGGTVRLTWDRKDIQRKGANDQALPQAGRKETL